MTRVPPPVRGTILVPLKERILRLLLDSSGEVVSHATLLSQLGYTAETAEEHDRCMLTIRQTMYRLNRDPVFAQLAKIHAEYGKGYFIKLTERASWVK